MKKLFALLCCLCLLVACATPAPPAPQTKPREYLTSHILCHTQAEAQQALDRIRAGERFEVVAREVSLDMGSRKTGGQIGWGKPTMYVPQYADEIVRLKVGEMSSQPVHSIFGWHIVRVDAVRDLQ